ncbi:CD109 antigen-like isoform X2 [Panonychus citri]|uniref:CD109 antigen-like isoform X2 n=1 Tax=Panonychus citri TaxID=50023 RepID=UPI002307DDFC|nr:CD109 antigen-like isoform X2 [Panonychus citri]
MNLFVNFVWITLIVVFTNGLPVESTEPGPTTYFVLASSIIRPGQVYKVIATVYETTNSLVTVRASILKDGVELDSTQDDCSSGIPEELLLRIPVKINSDGQFKLRVEGNIKGVLEGTAFLEERNLTFYQRSMTIFITTDKPIYMQGQTVKFRFVPITTDLKTFSDAVDVYMIDPNGNIVKRWLSRQSNQGAVSLEHPLSMQPIYGNWSIKVVAQGQEETKQFLVEEYYQTRFEVNVSMPAFFLSTDEYIYGSVMANFTSGVPVTGNLTILVTVDQSRGPGSGPKLPGIEESIKYFEGYHEFRFKMSQLSQMIGGNSLDGAKVTVHASVGEYFLNLIHRGYSRAYIFGSKIKLSFLGSSPQVFKPQMPVKTYLAVSYQDGSPLLESREIQEKINVTIKFFNQQSLFYTTTRTYSMSTQYRGIWEISFDPKLELKGSRSLETIHRCRIEAFYMDSDNKDSARASLDFYSSYAPTNRLVQVSTSTSEPKVGEYIIFHVRSNYFVDRFSYAIVSKGIILTTGREEMPTNIKTFSVTLSPEMAPSSTIVIYNIARGGEVISDALTFSVNGISRNNFTISLNNQKDKSGDTVEVVVYGQPGTYVGIAATDKDVNTLDAGNQINHADVLRKMSTFDHQTNSSLTHVWVSREGSVDKFIHFPSPTIGIDSNRTFEYAGLIVFTDANITKRPETCGPGEYQCLSGEGCYRDSHKCDGSNKCFDGTDENGCPVEDHYGLTQFRINRNNRLLRIYENSWLWKDINIGSHGYYTFNVPVPQTPAKWLVTAFGISNSQGFGLHQKTIEYSSTRPFFMNVEMPSLCTIGEQIGIRVSIFNYMESPIEVLVILGKSKDYKFVHVEAFGFVSSYAPRISSGEHQHLVFVRPQKATTVYIPIVSQRLGNITVTIIAKTQVAKSTVQKVIKVESDGIPQHLHTAAVLDLSQGAQLIKYLDTNLTDTPIIPLRNDRRYIYGSTKATVSIVGDVVGPVFPSMPLTTENLLRKPYGCAEQNMYNFAANMYTLLYLRLTGQKSTELEKQAFRYLNIQYQRQLSYQNEDGSFRAFRFDDKPSVWLTAFCVRIFHKATFQEWESYLYIDRKIIEKATQWLLTHQTSEGAFYETALHSYDRKMNSSSKIPMDSIRYRNISLTAHVLISLAQLRGISGHLSPLISNAKHVATQYLEKMLAVVKTLEDPYELSIVTYALNLVNSPEAESAFNELDNRMREVSGMRYWSKYPLPAPKTTIENNRPYLLPRLPHEYDSLNIETTAYGLLTHIIKTAVIQREIVEWLNTNRLYNGGWASTQDSIIALQALVEYSIQSRIRDITDIEVTIEAPSSPDFSERIEINSKNLARLQSFDIPRAYGPVIIRASGSGLAIIQLDVQYNVDWPQFQIPPPIRAFQLDVKLRSFGRNNSHISYRACSQWILSEESSSSGMAVLDLTIPTGYMIQQQDLDAYVKSGKVRNLKEAKYSERKALFYFDYLDSNPVCVTFTAQRWYPVANMSRFIPARVYDYYAPERYEELMVSTYDLYRLSICHVCGSYQCPYCPIFSGAEGLRNKINLEIMFLSLIMLFFTNRLINFNHFLSVT